MPKMAVMLIIKKYKNKKDLKNYQVKTNNKIKLNYLKGASSTSLPPAEVIKAIILESKIIELRASTTRVSVSGNARTDTSGCNLLILVLAVVRESMFENVK